MSQRLSRREMKRDEVLDAFGRAVEFLRRNARGVLAVIAAVAVLAVALAGWRAYRGGREVRASEKLAEAVRVFAAGIDAENPDPGHPRQPVFADEASRDRRAAELFAGVRTTFAGSDAAAIATVYEAELAVRAGDEERARSLWEAFLARRPDHFLAAEVELNLIALERSQGRGEELVERLEGLLAGAAPTSLPEDMLLFQLAQTLETLGREEEAAAAYERLVENHPGSPYSASARARGAGSGVRALAGT